MGACTPSVRQPVTKNTGRGTSDGYRLRVLADVETGYPLLLSELTFTTALRTAAMSVLAAREWLVTRAA